MSGDGRMGRVVWGVVTAACLIGLPLPAAEAHKVVYVHRSPRPRVAFVLPHGSVRLRFGSGTYYYYRGRYFQRRRPFTYVVVPAPVGVVVPSLPPGHRTIIVEGVTYHEYDGVYYKGGPSGYTVVPLAPAPSGAAEPAVPVWQGQPSTAAPAATVVNVPNKNGSYTPVPLQPAGGNMYLGPQGEIYPNLPTAQQLQGLYGK